MTLEDPFYVVKDEVFKALNKTRGLYLRWQEISKSPTIANSPEVEWTSTELRNALRSIEWDLEDLEDTIIPSIVERNSSKFRVDNKEICDRKGFIEATKQEVKGMRGRLAGAGGAAGARRDGDADGTACEPLLGAPSPPPHFAAWKSTPKYNQYSKLASQADSPTRSGGAGLALAVSTAEGAGGLPHDAAELARQEAQLAALGRTVSSLRAVSTSVGAELDEHNLMLESLGSELEDTGSALDHNVKKVARLLHVNNDRRQWLAILTLVCLLLIILLLFIVL